MLGEIARAGYIRAHDYPSYSRTLYRMKSEGLISPLISGVYTMPGECRPGLLATVICERHPEAVVTGRTAATLTFWNELRASSIAVSLPAQPSPVGPYVFSRQRVPPELRQVTSHYTVTAPALTALDLCDELGGDGIDQALRSRATTLKLLWEAFELTPGRPGNQERRYLLLDSRDEPWSAAERLLHRVLRKARVTGWVANHPIPTGPVGCYFADVAFPARKVIIEVEGHRFHSTPEQLHRDRERQNHLTALGWRVVRVDWPMLVNEPDSVIRLVSDVLRRRHAG